MSDAEPTGGRPVDWDASSYDSLADPQEEWAREVLERLELRGNETVMDAGCGSGRVTRLLVERLPQGKVVAVDASPSMVDMVRQVLRPQDEALRLFSGFGLTANLDSHSISWLTWPMRSGHRASCRRDCGLRRQS